MVDRTVVKGAICECAQPQPEVRATWKGAARTHCVRCGLPVPLVFVRG
jgi:hypothetical protein